MRTREILLAARPNGMPGHENFELVETELPAPADGEVLVRNLFMSVDPYMRGRMNDVKSYVPPFQVGKPLEGGAVGEVVESRVDGVAAGDLVLHGYGWREHSLVPRKDVVRLDRIPGLSPSLFLGALGMTAHTAYVGLLDMASFKAGDTVFVSGAMGAVGSVAGQIARLKGARRVIGSAGTPDKVAYLTEKLGFDAAFNYRDGDVKDLLAEAAPDGIDVYFDNVGGDHLEAAIGALNLRGRIASCGSISMYNMTEPPPGPRNMHLFVGKRLSMRGFIILDHADRLPDMIREVSPWISSGELVVEETVVAGLDNAPEAFLGLFRGENTGKMVVKLT